MSKNWMVAIDDSIWAEFAFNYALCYLSPQIDRLYMIHVKDIPMKFANWDSHRDIELINYVNEAEDSRSRKIIGNYVKRCREAHLTYSILHGTSTHPGEVISKAVRDFAIHICVLGRRSLSPIQRFLVGSTSRYVIEHADCVVIVIKAPMLAEEYHVDLREVLNLEETERQRRLVGRLQYSTSMPSDSKVVRLIDELAYAKGAEEMERQERIADYQTKPIAIHKSRQMRLLGPEIVKKKKPREISKRKSKQENEGRTGKGKGKEMVDDRNQF